jgi:tetratricopeptide (TPR) repeat protein
LYEAVRLQAEAGNLADSSKDFTLIARYYQGYGVTWEMIAEREHSEEYYDRALIAYEAACHYYELAGNVRDLASTQNCIAFLFIQVGKLEEALDFSIRAIRNARTVADIGLLAECELTRAQACARIGRYDVALPLASGAAVTFKEKGYEPLLKDALETVERISAAMRAQDD